MFQVTIDITIVFNGKMQFGKVFLFTYLALFMAILYVIGKWTATNLSKTIANVRKTEAVMAMFISGNRK